MPGIGIGTGLQFNRSKIAALLALKPDWEFDPFKVAPGLTPGLLLDGVTKGPLIQQYDGSYVQTLAGERALRGGRRLYNLLNETDTLATQGVTVEEADYWLCFEGTGSVAVTGVATDSLAGTGVDDRVSKKITMGSAGTATFTVTGSVTSAALYKSRPGQTVADPEYISRGVEILGEEIIANGDFASGDLTGWIDPNEHWAVASGKAVHASSSAFNMLLAPVPLSARGRDARLTFAVSDYSGESGIRVQFRDSSQNAIFDDIPYGDINAENAAIVADGSISYRGLIPSDAAYIAFARDDGSQSAAFSIDNVSLRSVVHHGYGPDGVAWFATDEYGNDLTVGLGPEKLTNGDFSDGAAGWTVNAGWEISNGRAEHLPGGPAYLSRTGVFTVGREYEITLDIGGDNPKVELPSAFYDPPREFTGSGTKTVRTRAKAVTMYLYGSNERPGWIDNISVREVYPVQATVSARWPQITNLLDYSSPYDWSKTQVTIAPPDVDGWCLLSNSAAGGVAYHYATRALTLANGQTVLSIDVKYEAGSGWVWLLSETSTDVFAFFNVLTGTVGSASGFDSTSMEALPGGGYRLHAVATKTSGTSAQQYGIGVALADGTPNWNSTGLADQEQVYVRFGQLETGSVAHDHVPTAGTAVAADASVDSVDKAAAGIEDEGIWLVEHVADLPATASLNEQAILSLFRDNSNRATLYNQTGGLGMIVNDTGSTQWLGGNLAAAWTAGEMQSIALRLETDDGSLVTDGSVRNVDASMSVPPTDVVYLGGDSGSKYQGGIRRVRYYKPGRLSDAKLLEMTA